MISIFKYLYGGERPPARHQTAAIEEIYRSFTGVLDSIDRHMLAGEGGEPLRRDLGRAKDMLHPSANTEQVSQAEGIVAALLAEHQALSQQAAVAQAIEVQHIFAMLNQALIVLAEGRDRSVSRLNEIQESIEHASRLRDIVALKSALAETVQLVQEESRHARESLTEELGRLETEVEKARDFIGASRVALSGRTEGMKMISECLENPVPGQGLYAIAYLFDRLQAVTQRYGAVVAEELTFRLIKERLLPVAPANQVYRWSRSSLVGIVTRRRDLESIQAEVANLNRTPVVHRIALGSRTAVLTVTPSQLVAEGQPGSPELLIEQLDKFAGARA